MFVTPGLEKSSALDYEAWAPVTTNVGSSHKREGHCSGENGQNNNPHYHNFLYGIAI